MAKQASSTGKLTPLGIGRLGPGRHGDGRGLYLVVGPSGGRSWIVRYKINGRSREMGLGAPPVVTLADARDKAIDARRLLAKGIDPIEHRNAERAETKRASVTFGAFAKDFIASKESGWRNSKHRDQWRMTLLGMGPKGEAAKHDYCKSLRPLTFDAIDTAAVLKVLQPIWSTKPETAGRLRGRIEAVLDAAKVAGLRSSGENPARWKGQLAHMLPAKQKVRRVQHFPALPYGKVPAFVAELRKHKDSIAAAALEYCILTASRPGNVQMARWREINRASKTWTIPPDLMKGEAEHIVPLSDAALAVLDRMEQVGNSEFIFPSLMGKGRGRRPSVAGGPISNAAMAAVIDRMNAETKVPRWIDPTSGRAATPHGTARSSFHDWASETGAAPEPVIESCLAHVVSDETIAAYRRTKFQDWRRRVMVAWADFITGNVADNVVQLRPGA